MSKGYMSNNGCDYICSFCGDIMRLYAQNDGKEKKYTIRQLYCPVCMVETDHILLGDKDLVRCELEFKDVLEGMDYEVYNLLTINDYKEKTR